MKKVIVAIVAIVSLSGCASHSLSVSDRALLYDFVRYCKNNEGLEQSAAAVTRTTDDKRLIETARYFAEQDNFADVSDYWEISAVDAILYR